MSRHNSGKPDEKGIEHVLKELREAGLQVAATRAKPSEIPYYSSVSSQQKQMLVVK